MCFNAMPTLKYWWNYATHGVLIVQCKFFPLMKTKPTKQNPNLLIGLSIGIGLVGKKHINIFQMHNID